MARLVLVLVLALLVGISSAGMAATPAARCAAQLPRGPSVPAPVVLRTSCGGYWLGRDGAVTRLPQRWFDARAGGTGRRYGADLRFTPSPDRRIVLGRHGRVVWRAKRLYRNEGGAVAFGPGLFAFSSHRRGVFVTDLRAPERLVARGVGLYPVAFMRDGSLLVAASGWAPSITRITADGRVLGRYRYRPKNGYLFDERTEGLYLVTPHRVLVLVTVSGARAIRPLGDLDGWVGSVGRFLTLSDFAHQGRSDRIRFAVLRRDGDVVSRFTWHSPRGADVDYGPVASADGRSFGFRTVTRPRGQVVVYLLRAGEKRPVAAFRHRGRQLGCGVGADFSWKGRYVLYSATDGSAAIFDSRSEHMVSLRKLAAELAPDRLERPTVSWASAFRPNDWRHA